MTQDLKNEIMNIGELMPKLSLEEHHEYLEQEVGKQEKLRKYNRDFKEKIRLIDLKKMKLKIKDKIFKK
jgi:hypothetical protein|tara:strand:+ start:631 stop:837 length:207 start_codon:yes stop_codon:yes gene_type:complete